MPRLKYRKPSYNIDEKILLLKERWLIFYDEILESHDLKHTWYYRFSWYFKFFQEQDNVFIEWTTFKQTLNLYVFDRKLRLLTLDAIEKIEVSLRWVIDNYISKEQWKFWFLDTNCFYLKDTKNLEVYSKLIWKIKWKKFDKDSVIVRSFFRKYDEDYLPSWMLFEHLTIWEIANIYKVLKKNIQENISLEYNINFLDFHTWIVLMNKVRNISAHHSRLWNKLYNIRLKTDDVMFWDKFQKKLWHNWQNEVISNYYNTALVINCLLKKINPNLNWLSDLEALFNEYDYIPKDKMWFWENWQQEFEQ
jgi:abortive infection bacteriophage resistance protein